MKFILKGQQILKKTIDLQQDLEKRYKNIKFGGVVNWS
jgi:hypothetical protein